MLQKTKNKKNTHKYGIWIVALVLVVALAGGGYWLTKKTDTSANFVNSDQKKSGINYSPAQPSDNSSNENRKSSPNPSTTLNDGGSKTSSGSSTTTTGASFSVQLVSSNVNNGNVHVGTLVNGATTGDCTLTVSQSGQTSITRTSTVAQDVNDYDCGAFNIPTSDFPSSGTWNLNLTVISNGVQESDTSSVVITNT
jgi:hypothetical protein